MTLQSTIEEFLLELPLFTREIDRLYMVAKGGGYDTSFIRDDINGVYIEVAGGERKERHHAIACVAALITGWVSGQSALQPKEQSNEHSQN